MNPNIPLRPDQTSDTLDEFEIDYLNQSPEKDAKRHAYARIGGITLAIALAASAATMEIKSAEAANQDVIAEMGSGSDFSAPNVFSEVVENFAMPVNGSNAPYVTVDNSAIPTIVINDSTAPIPSTETNNPAIPADAAGSHSTASVTTGSTPVIPNVEVVAAAPPAEDMLAMPPAEESFTEAPVIPAEAPAAPAIPVAPAVPDTLTETPAMPVEALATTVDAATLPSETPVAPVETPVVPVETPVAPIPDAASDTALAPDAAPVSGVTPSSDVAPVPAWNGKTLNPVVGIIDGPSGEETHYNLPMGGIVNRMRSMGNNDQYWVREDGAKMLGPYVMVAANLNVHPRGTLVQTSLGLGLVCDTGEFAKKHPNRIDIATDW